MNIILITLIMSMFIIVFFVIKINSEHKQEIASLRRRELDIQRQLDEEKNKRPDIVSDEEQKILNSFRNITNQAQKAAIAANVNSFSEWLKKVLPEIWNNVKNFIADLWNNLKNWFK